MKTPQLSVDESRGTWLSCALAVAYVACVAFGNEYRDVFEIDPDESNNLIKALLIEHGASFGGELWSDQPPLFTYLLAGWLRLLGPSVEHARTLVLSFGGWTVFACVDSARRLGGPLPALGSFAWLVGSTSFVQLSVSVMIGLPSVALLAGACWAFVVSTSLPRWGATRRRLAWLVGSGALLGASLGTKLFTGFAVVVLGLAVLASTLARSRGLSSRAKLRALGGAWGAFVFGFVLVFGLTLLPYLGASGEQELIEAHAGLRATRSGWFVGAGSVRGFLRDDALLFALAGLGIVVAFVRERHASHVFTAWLGLGMLALALHFPVWPHHRVLLTVPGAWLAGFGLGSLMAALGRLAARRVSSAAGRLALAALFGVASLALPIGVVASSPSRWSAMQRPQAWSNSRKDRELQRQFDRYARDATRVVASRPIFAFRAGKPVPPALAVTSWKRFRSDQLSARQVAREVRKYRPQVVLLTSRWPHAVRNAVRRELSGRYRRAFHTVHQSAEIWVLDETTTLPPSASGTSSTSSGASASPAGSGASASPAGSGASASPAGSGASASPAGSAASASPGASASPASSGASSSPSAPGSSPSE